uniref:Endogenous retrovirus group K3 member 1 n=1 Tax=Macaca fascicularis TaxID=9541 RepID=A0A7N9CRG9_MACFA
MDKPCGCPPGVCDHGMGDQRDPWYSTMGLFPPVRAMSQRNLNAKTERGPTGVTMTANPITWGQIKKTTQEAEKLLERQGQAKTPDSMFLAMLAVVSCAVCFPCVEAKTYWAYVPNPPAVRLVLWSDTPPEIYHDQGAWAPGPLTPPDTEQ